MQVFMAPRGGKTRTKKNVTEQDEREPFDDEGLSGKHDDVTTSDTVPESSGRVRGPDRPRSSRLVGEGKLIVTRYDRKILGHGVPRFFRDQIRKRLEDLWPRYSDVD
ncbi:hypothetical protein LIER_14420 [Lithospermum erythrorhizon]|uniref:Uncharacterized protein n=1 Tax=Lithospermum erythrorhizon TaxID=34254 RepID=A0AAV3PZ90_LITER